MAETNLKELFHHTLKDVYYAENAILKALPKMSQAAGDKALKEAFDTHLKETQGQVKRLEAVFKVLGEKPEGEKCHALEGLTKEADEIVESFPAGPARDAGLIAAAQAVEHYEISRYGSLRAWAQQLELDEAVELLSETLAEEEATDDLLSQLGEDVVNPAAAA
ncbi:ferritin-like domain-containing protein [Chthonobacter albigriseus]|uniref:YciE/YciF ferroxidase family protein n=1 Tax=Chthonobacter albigriseus TaxID=1683161 RepID=UPI0015EF05E5|nr:ferritin-like domain-containing protein [Chthonobacter albigriseus]